jgi:hypothetical protein
MFFFQEGFTQGAMWSKLSRRVTSLGAWLVSASQMKSISSMG